VNYTKNTPFPTKFACLRVKVEFFRAYGAHHPNCYAALTVLVPKILFHETIPVSEVGEIVCIGEPCLSEPCQNGATCTANNETGAYECICPPDYTGVDCQMGKYLQCESKIFSCGLRFLTFFHKRLRILKQFLRTYYTFLSTLGYKFLFNYLKL